MSFFLAAIIALLFFFGLSTGVSLTSITTVSSWLFSEINLFFPGSLRAGALINIFSIF